MSGMMRGFGALLLAGTLWCPSLGAQGSLLARADSAYAAGDAATARRLYAEVLVTNPDQSRAVFQLARLEASPHRSLALYRRYTELEPDDAWGHMALGDALALRGQLRAALISYDRAGQLAPGERDVAVGRARAHSRCGDPEGAMVGFRAWLASHLDDAEAWELLGREELRAGRSRSARTSFERARALGRNVPGTLAMRAQRDVAPALEPVAGYQRDSDGNRSTRAGAVVDLAPADQWRIGLGAFQGLVRDDFASVTTTEGLARAAVRPRSNLRILMQAGATRFSDDLSGTSWTAPAADVRLRWRASGGGPALEVRAEHMALGVSPQLIANEVQRTEGRAMLELPAGPLRIRGMGRVASVSAAGESANQRLAGSGALVLPLGWRGELSAQYHRMGYQRPSQAGYFAPEVVETMEGGAYLELGEDGPLSLAIDLGAGSQRIAEHDAPYGRWARALRGWSMVSFALAPGRALWLETEAYDAAFAPEGTATSSSWRFVSASLGLRWALR
jgi:tetratricopeptide (TPR) repeat protein